MRWEGWERGRGGEEVRIGNEEKGGKGGRRDRLGRKDGR